MKRNGHFTSILFVGASIFIFSSCTIIGFATGAVVDSSNPRTIEDPVEQLMDIPKSSRVQVFLKNGEIRNGRFTACVTEQGNPDKIKYLSLSEKSRELILPIEVIDHVAVMEIPKRNKWIGVGAGALLDVILFGIIKAASAAGG